MGHEVSEGGGDGDEEEVADAGVGEVGEAAGAVLDGSHHDVGVDDAVEGLVVAAGEVGGGDAIQPFLRNILTKCAVFTFENDTGGDVDDIHI